jgi:hypothetical protein
VLTVSNQTVTRNGPIQQWRQGRRLQQNLDSLASEDFGYGFVRLETALATIRDMNDFRTME